MYILYLLDVSSKTQFVTVKHLINLVKYPYTIKFPLILLYINIITGFKTFESIYNKLQFSSQFDKNKSNV